MLSAGLDRPIHTESHGHFAGLARGHRGRLLRRYTTFSSFGWETAKMLEDGEWLRATAYVAVSVVAGLLLSVAGIRLANQL
jgi:fluoride ion exporter CrcB/FEX